MRDAYLFFVFLMIILLIKLLCGLPANNYVSSTWHTNYNAYSHIENNKIDVCNNIQLDVPALCFFSGKQGEAGENYEGYGRLSHPYVIGRYTVVN